MTARLAAGAALAALALGGCARRRAPVVEPGRPFALTLGAAARTPDGLAIRYVALIDDSRCPLGAQCVWAGTVRVAVALQSPSAGRRVDTLDLTRQPRSAPIGGVTVRLAQFAPAAPPPGAARIPASQTVATFVVER